MLILRQKMRAKPDKSDELMAALAEISSGRDYQIPAHGCLLVPAWFRDAQGIEHPSRPVTQIERSPRALLRPEHRRVPPGRGRLKRTRQSLDKWRLRL